MFIQSEQGTPYLSYCFHRYNPMGSQVVNTLLCGKLSVNSSCLEQLSINKGGMGSFVLLIFRPLVHLQFIFSRQDTGPRALGSKSWRQDTGPRALGSKSWRQDTGPRALGSKTQGHAPWAASRRWQDTGPRALGSKSSVARHRATRPGQQVMAARHRSRALGSKLWWQDIGSRALGSCGGKTQGHAPWAASYGGKTQGHAPWAARHRATRPGAARHRVTCSSSKSWRQDTGPCALGSKSQDRGSCRPQVMVASSRTLGSKLRKASPQAHEPSWQQVRATGHKFSYPGQQ